MRLGGVGWGGTPVPGFGCPTTPLGPPSWVSRTCWGMTELGKVGSKVAQRGGGGCRGPQGADGAVQPHCWCIPVTGQCQGLHMVRNNPRAARVPWSQIYH